MPLQLLRQRMPSRSTFPRRPLLSTLRTSATAASSIPGAGYRFAPATSCAGIGSGPWRRPPEPPAVPRVPNDGPASLQLRRRGLDPHLGGALDLRAPPRDRDPAHRSALGPPRAHSAGVSGPRPAARGGARRTPLAVVSHNHYDHLDALDGAAPAPLALEWLVPLGLGPLAPAHGARRVRELDWWETHRRGAVAAHLPARPALVEPGPSPGATRSLWGSWLIETATARVFFAGDTG